jgi:hypothetical protein
MTTLMQRSASWLGTKLQSTAVAGTAVSVTATHALTEHEVIDREGFPTKARFHDWTFTAADLLIFSEQIEPRPGDRIEVSSTAYEVLPLDDKRPCWEPLDADGILIVVHTKQA